LALHEDTLLISRDGGASWVDWETATAIDAAVASVAAPHGLAPGATLLLGLMDGTVLRV
jgi:hypothetical protein